MLGLGLRRKRVLFKPNLAEYIHGAEFNTNPLMVGAAAGAFLALGAKTVVVAEGPGRRRDTIWFSLRAALNRSCGTASSVPSI